MLIPAPLLREYSRIFRLFTYVLAILLSGEMVTINDSTAQVPSSASPFRVEDWFGIKKAKPRIGNDPGVPTTVILADHLDLSSQTYRYSEKTAPKNIIIIADTVELKDLAVFDLSAEFMPQPNDRSAGQLVIFARRFICSANAQIVFRGLAHSFLSGPNAPIVQAGRFFFGINSLEISPELRDKILTRLLMRDDIIPEGTNRTLNPETRRRLITLVEHTYKDASIQTKWRAFLNTKTSFDEDLINFVSELRSASLDNDIKNDPGQIVTKYLTTIDISVPQSPVTPGVFRTATNVESLMQYTDDFRIAFSKWAVHWITNMESKINEALLLNDQEILFESYSLVQEFVKQFPSSLIDLSQQTSYARHLENIHNKTRDRITLYRETIDINSLGLSANNVDVFYEGSSKSFRVGPTSFLLREIVINGSPKIGFCRYDYNNPKELEFYVTGDLTVDPNIIFFLVEEMKKRNQQYTGVFRNWDLSSFEFNTLPGFVDRESSIVVRDSSLQAKLVFAQSGIGLIKWSTEGLPVRLKWAYSSDPKITGIFRNIVLKRTSRQSPQIEVLGNTVKNVGKTKVIIRYVIVGENQVINFTPFIEVNSGESAKLPLRDQLRSDQITIPPAAVEVLYANYLNFEDDFQIVYSDQNVEEITVSNKLTIKAVPNRDAIEYIEINVSSGAKQEWKAKLLPYPNRGSSDKRWFLRSQNQERLLSVSGRIHYQDGSFDDLKPQVTSHQEILIGLESISEEPK